MKKFKTADHIHDIFDKINRVKNCIKKNTSEATMFSQIISFPTKENIHIQIKLYN